ncbi:MAG: C69 family dipeptidase [Lachnospiraceae bacterium]
MPCTTILVGKRATYDGSTMIARNEDSGAGHFTPKRFVVIRPEEQKKVYKSVISHLEVGLPDDPMRYTAMPNAMEDKGIWAASGVNEAQVAMTATETITSNPRVLGADPLVRYQPAEDGREEIPGGIGEEDIVYLVLPYIRSAREGVVRLGSLLEQYGTYEMNGIAFQDADEIWWLETIGGHHWIARRVPDDVYVVMPNQLGLDRFDLEDALHGQKEYMCSPDMREFIEKNHLNLSMDGGLNPRDAFGSHDDADYVYNTPRAWFTLRYLNPHTKVWDGPNADYRPEADDIPWCMVPEKKITVEDVKYALSTHYQGTPYDPYGSCGDPSLRGIYRPVGVNRNDFVGVIQIRPGYARDNAAIEWISYGSNVFNALAPFYADIGETPEYLSNTTEEVSTDNFYWSSRLIAAMADASYRSSIIHIERYREHVMSKGHELIARYDELLEKEVEEEKRRALRAEANREIAKMLKKETQTTLDLVLFELSSRMKNAFARSDFKPQRQ